MKVYSEDIFTVLCYMTYSYIWYLKIHNIYSQFLAIWPSPIFDNWKYTGYIHSSLLYDLFVYLISKKHRIYTQFFAIWPIPKFDNWKYTRCIHSSLLYGLFLYLISENTQDIFIVICYMTYSYIWYLKIHRIYTQFFAIWPILVSDI